MNTTTVSITNLDGNVVKYNLNDYKYIVYNKTRSQATREDVLWFGVSNTKGFILRQITSTNEEINIIIENYLKEYPEKIVKYDGCCFNFPDPLITQGVYVMTECNHEDREYYVLGVYKTKQSAMAVLQELSDDRECKITIQGEEAFFHFGKTWIGYVYSSFK